MPRPPDKPIVFTRHEDIQEMPFVGYRRLLDAGYGMGRKVLEEGGHCPVLCAGFPGTGKTVYPQVLARKLPGYSLLYVKSNSLMRIGDSEDNLRQLRDMERYLSNTPLIVAFDELDLLTPERTIRPIGQTRVTGVMMDILDLKPEKTLTLVMANYPLNLDMAINSRLEYVLYFDLPEAGDLGDTLEGMGIPNAHKVGELLYAKAEETRGRYVIRSLVRACKRVKERSEDPEEMAGMLFPHAPQFDLAQVRDFERMHEGFKSRSEHAIEYWERIAKQYS